MASSPQTLSLEDRRRVASWAADCAEYVLPIYEAAVPSDATVRDAIEQARAFARGDLAVGDAIRHRGARAGTAARDAPTPAAKAAAYAAHQAAAVAHMGAHALGAAGYAAKAAILASDGDDATLQEMHRRVMAMSTAVADALSRLPALGDDVAGPLGPGPLSKGLVGRAIQAIQDELRLRL